MSKFVKHQLIDDIQNCWNKLLDVRDRLRVNPATIKLSERMSKICMDLEEIEDELNEV